MAAPAIGLLVLFLEPQGFDMPTQLCGGRMATDCMGCTCLSKPCDGEGG